MKYNIGKKQRLRLQEDIARVFDSGNQASDRFITLRAAKRELDGSEWVESRMAVTVSGRFGNAVRRNRIKRLCREAFRLVRAELPAGFDFVIVPRRGELPSLEELKNSLRALGGKVAKSRRSADE